MDTLGQKLKKLRKTKKWTLEEVAGKLGLKGHSTYSNWEYDRREPDLETIARIAELYDVELSYLMPTKNSVKTLEKPSNDQILKLYDIVSTEDKIEIISSFVEGAKIEGLELPEFMEKFFSMNAKNHIDAITRFSSKYSRLDDRKKKMIDDMIEMLGDDE